jgi:hypothetical protein
MYLSWYPNKIFFTEYVRIGMTRVLSTQKNIADQSGNFGDVFCDFWVGTKGYVIILVPGKSNNNSNNLSRQSGDVFFAK